MTDALGTILKKESAHLIIMRMINNQNTIEGFLNDKNFGKQNIEEIFKRSTNVSKDNSADYQKICVELLNNDLINSHLELQVVKDFAKSHKNELKESLEILKIIAEEENYLQAQKSAVRAIRTVGFAIAASYFLKGYTIPVAYASTYIKHTPLLDWLRGNSKKEPISGYIGKELGRYGEIFRIEYSTKKLSILKWWNKDNSRDHIESSNNYKEEIWNAKLEKEIRTNIHSAESHVKHNDHQAEKEMNKFYLKGRTAVLIGLACFVLVAGISVATGGLAPLAALNVGLVLGLTATIAAYAGYEPAQKVLDGFSKFSTKSYQKLKDLFTSHKKTNIESPIESNGPKSNTKGDAQKSANGNLDESVKSHVNRLQKSRNEEVTQSKTFS